METVKRVPLQGITNIIRFNWHYYAIAGVALLLLYVGQTFLLPTFQNIMLMVIALISLSIIVSLLASFYVYDCSNLYSLDWLDTLEINPGKAMVNVNAGFDETSGLLEAKYPSTNITVLDFYDPAKHTEVSIKRARKAYPAYPGTIAVNPANLPLESKSVDCIFVLLAAHEIRNTEERIAFFKELKRILRLEGKIVVLEHLRDLPNLLAYNIGFFHFFSKRQWLYTFKGAGLHVSKQQRHTPFICTFILQHNGTSS